LSVHRTGRFTSAFAVKAQRQDMIKRKRGRVQRIWTVAVFLSLVGSQLVAAEDKPTSLTEARASVEANLRTPEGKAYDQQLGAEFVQKHLGAVRQCKQTGADDLRSFWILLKLNKDGTVKEILLYPATKVGTCAREALLKDNFSPPPQPEHWVSIYLKMGS